jgi:predicted AlkP superfamily phosphohydrolase/phosphomutase
MQPLLQPDYKYKRADGDEVYCYGKIEEDSNFSIVCDDEDYDGIAADIDATIYNTFRKVCKYLEANYRADIAQIETC